MQDKFFEVIAKCGHVGRNRYVEGKFYEIAQSKKEAAAVVRYKPRVKHDHKDAIISVREITQEEYIIGLEETNKNPYFACKSRWQQNLVWEHIIPMLRLEPSKEKFRRTKTKNPYNRTRSKRLFMSELAYEV